MRAKVAHMKLAAAFLFACVAIFISLPAAADEPLNGSGPEPCTLESAQKENRECVVCRAYYRNRKHCERALPEYNFSKVCRTRDASAWREVWCRKPDATSKKLSAEFIASLDDATAGEKNNDGGTEPTAEIAPLPTDAGPSPDATQPPIDPKSDTMVVHKPEGGCTCSSAGEKAPFEVPLGTALVALVTLVSARRITRCTRGRSAR